jgi:hypothetical protein
LVCATALHCAPPLAGREAPIVPGDWWEDTRIAMPPECDIDPHARSLFAAGPVFYAIVP